MSIQPTNSTNRAADTGITALLAQENRSLLQIGSETDYFRVTRGVRVLLFCIIGLVAILLALSFVIKIQEVARARGQFTPVQRVQVIQSAEGGAIESIMVHNGDRVVKGELIAQFRGSDLIRDLQRADVRGAYLEINIERLDALAEGRVADFKPFAARYSIMVQEANSLLTEQARSVARSLDQKDREVEEERSGLSAAKQQIPAAKSSLDASNDLLQRTRKGAAEKVISLSRLAEIEEQAAQAARVYTQLVASLDQHEARIARVGAERDAVLAKAAADARNERAGLIAELDELRATRMALQARFRDVQVRAPVNGIVQKISETPIGTVIPPGGTVCEIVPTDGGVSIQVHLSPRDIGFVEVGQKAIVKSDAFDYGRFGSIAGKVARIAATNTQDLPDEAPYILVEITLDQPYVGSDSRHLVTPGMTGEASILTGEKTIFQYLLKPIYLTLDTAFRER